MISAQTSEVQREFARRYFLWALEQARDAATANFSQFSWIEDGAVLHFLDYARNWGKEAAGNVLEIMVRAAHEMGRLPAEALSDQELALLKVYVGRSRVNRGSPGWASGVTSTQYLDNVHKELTHGRNIHGEHVLDSIVDKLPGFTRNGPIVEQTSGLGDWVVETRIWSDPRTKFLEYSHTIQSAKAIGGRHCSLGRTVRASNGLSVLEWLGIAPRTLWSSFVQLSADEIATKLAVVINTFLIASSRLLKDLPVSDS